MNILLAILAAFALSATAADAPAEPPSLVGFSENEIGSPIFLTTWSESPATTYNVKCGGEWRFVVSQRPANPDGDLMGCYRFTADQQITIIWNVRGKPIKLTYETDVFQFTNWFLKEHPEHGPVQDKEPETGRPDTKL